MASVLGVRRLRRLDRRGAAVTVSTVFCPGRSRSLPLASCRQCQRFVGESEHAIECTPPSCEHSRRALPLASRLGGDICVGEAVAEETLWVHEDVPCGEVRRELAHQRAGVAVVADDQGRSVGVIHGEDAPLFAASASARRVARRVAGISEAAPLAHAIERMVRERARALPVIDDEGRAVGLVTDLDALDWVARRPKAPPEDPR